MLGNQYVMEILQFFGYETYIKFTSYNIANVLVYRCKKRQVRFSYYTLCRIRILSIS